LNNLNLQKIAENLIDTFLNAGETAKDISRAGLKITYKSDNSPVTNGDLAVDKILRAKIANLTSDIEIISEETVNLEDSSRKKDFWLIDPIDGTRQYIQKKDEYTLNAALIIDSKPAIGIIYAPEKNRLFYSYGKNNAFEISSNKRKKIILNCEKKNKSEIIGLENSGKTPDEVLKIYKEYGVNKKVQMSSSLKFCILAAGEADIYAANARACEWDIAAGHAILDHAGGQIKTQQGNSFSYGKEKYKNLSIIAKIKEVKK
tara:strand:- start:209 stop:988 length:780 start_codon:yes stop_codon:yes gene_type:complete